MIDRPRFVEKQSFAPFVYGLMLVACAAALLPPMRMPISIVPLLLTAGISNILWMETTVTGIEVRVRFGYAFPIYTRTIPLADIADAEAVTYSPIGEFGGWGIRGVGANVALNARGDCGVRLRLIDGRRVLIGSQRAEELANAIGEAKVG